ncbi:MAG: UDP-N-acetylmuramate dehydrogenase [Ruminococcus sp.]|nr:UDP-N-acetylmuramate dehydrogenase [Ruminococcus sp.]
MDLTGLCSFAASIGCEVKTNEPLAPHTTFKVGGCCEAFIEINGPKSAAALCEAADGSGIRYCFLGNGSNVLFDDLGYKGAVFHIGSLMSDIGLAGNNRIRADAGTRLSSVCTLALDNSLSGLEFAYGIPGSVGGAVFMNAGAYGGEIKDVLVEVTVLYTVDHSIKRLERGDFVMKYRDTSFMNNGDIVLGAVFELKSGDKAEIKSAMDELIGRRRDKQPLEYPSAGSTFKRPFGYFAGKLIQDSGLRGFTIGGAQVSEKHCGFIINKGGATSADILALISHIQQTVKEKFGVELECEVRYIPYE